MASLKEIRTRIISVRSTQKITSAMKMVSAAKLRRAQTSILNFRPYSTNLSDIVCHLVSLKTEVNTNPLEEIRNQENIVIVLITSNKGLCGSFNNAILKHSENVLSKTYKDQLQQNKVQFICIGKKASDYVRKKRYPCLGAYNEIVNTCTYEGVSEIAVNLMNLYIDKKIDKVEIVYSKFKNASNQTIVNTPYLPISFDGKAEDCSPIDFICEPPKEILYQQLIPALIKMKLYQCVLESLASEHGARMTAMHKATENANDLIKELNLTYNKLRQASITNALIEMVSGAESLNAK